MFACPGSILTHTHTHTHTITPSISRPFLRSPPPDHEKKGAKPEHIFVVYSWKEQQVAHNQMALNFLFVA